MAASLHAQKVKEGDKFMEEGEKCLKTGLFKWTPNYDGAAQAFSRAGLSYKMGKAYDKAEHAYTESSTAYLGANSLFYSAKALEDAAGVCKESQKFDQAVHYLRQASERYRENGNPDTAGMVIEKAAKTMEHSAPDKAAVLYLEVASVHDSEEKHRETSNSLRKALNMFIRSGKLADAMKTTNKLERTYRLLQGWQNVHQVIAVKVLLHLQDGDGMEARQVYNEAFSIVGFDSSDEAVVIERLLEAYDEGDDEEITKCTTDPVYKCMDNDVARFAKSLKPKMMDLNALPSSARQQQPQQQEEEQQNISTGHKVSEKDERALLFATKHKPPSQPVEEEHEEEPQLPPVTKTPVEDDDDEDDELATLDIN